MVDYVGADVMVNLIEDAIVSVDCGKATTEVTPLLREAGHQGFHKP